MLLAVVRTGEYSSDPDVAGIRVQYEVIVYSWKNQDVSLCQSGLQCLKCLLTGVCPQERRSFFGQDMQRSSHVGKRGHESSVVRAEAQEAPHICLLAG